MKRRLLTLAVYLYPRAWRNRYAAEFTATLEDMPAPGWAAVSNVIQGALVMQIHRNGRAIATAAVLGALLAWAGSFAIRDVYRSEALITGQPAAFQSAVPPVLAKKRLQALIEKHGLYHSERESRPIEDVIQTMLQNISISAPMHRKSGDDAFGVAFRYPDARAANRVVVDLSQALLAEQPQLVLLHEASRSQQALYPNRKVIAFIGLLAGALFGALWAWRKRTAAT